MYRFKFGLTRLWMDLFCKLHALVCELVHLYLKQISNGVEGRVNNWCICFYERPKTFLLVLLLNENAMGLK